MAIPTLSDESLRIRERYRRVQRLVGVLVGVGLLIQLLGNPLFETSDGPQLGWGGAWAAGTVFHLAACILFARVKGRSPWLGFVGVLGIVGILILLLLDRECHRCGRRESKGVDECPSCGAPM